jgi:hypothetical protein
LPNLAQWPPATGIILSVTGILGVTGASMGEPLP